jgi:hypothetical protein
MRRSMVAVMSLALAATLLGADRVERGERGERAEAGRRQDRDERRARAADGNRVDTRGLQRTDSDYALSPQQALWAKISEVKFEQVPLRDALEWVQETLGTNMHVEWGALAEAGVTPEQPVNINLKWVRVPRLLQFIFQETGKGDALTFYVADNILVITSRAQADSQLFTRVYPVQDLVIRPGKVDRPDRDVLSPNVNGSGTGQGGFGGDESSALPGSRSGRDRRGDDDDDDDDDSDKERGEEVVEMVKQMTPADIWEENGGKSKIAYFRGNLILTAPRSVHAWIGGAIRE